MILEIVRTDGEVLRWVDRWIERSRAGQGGAARPASEQAGDLCLELAERVDDDFTLDTQETRFLAAPGRPRFFRAAMARLMEADIAGNVRGLR